MLYATLVDLDRHPVLDLDGAGARTVERHAAERRDDAWTPFFRPPG